MQTIAGQKEDYHLAELYMASDTWCG